MLNYNLERFQAYILANYGNVAYQRISKDTYFKTVPNELYEIWYSPYKFSFRSFKDVKDLPYLKGEALIIYYYNIIMIHIQLKIIFNKLKGGLSNG